MLHVFDRASMAQVLARDLDPQLRTLLQQRFDALLTPEGDLAACTEYVVIEPDDAEVDLIRRIGFSPLRSPDRPYDYVADLGGWFEIIISAGGSFAWVLLVQDTEGVLPELRSMCRSGVSLRGES